jgi:hypothetical protein
MFGWITSDRAGPLGGKCRIVSCEGRGVGLASRHLQGCSPYLCWLVPVSKYWTYRSCTGDIGLVSLVACCRQMFGFHYCFNAVLGEKLGGRPADHSAGLGVISGALFLRSSRVHPTLLMACERLPHTGTTRRKRTPGVRGLAWEPYVSCWSDFSLQGVHRFKSPRLSNMSNRLFVAIFT